MYNGQIEARMQFTAKDFLEFARKWGFQHIMSSPHYPQSNGKVEAAVKSLTKLIRAAWMKANKLCRAPLQYCNTPSRCHHPKNHMATQFRTFSPSMHGKSSSPECKCSTKDATNQANSILETTKQYYNSLAHPLPEIRVGINVEV